MVGCGAFSPVYKYHGGGCYDTAVQQYNAVRCAQVKVDESISIDPWCVLCCAVVLTRYTRREDLLLLFMAAAVLSLHTDRCRR